MRYERIMRAVMATPWAIEPSKLEEIMAFLELQAAGGKLTPERVRAGSGPLAAVRANPRAAGSVAVLPLYGVMGQRMNLMMEFSGGTSTEKFGAAFRQVMADPNVKAIVLDVDSPGGSVAGVAELADEISGARGQKPVVAVANSMAASAAYWVASAADEIVVTPGGMVGSIGVYTAHTDVSKAAEAMGVKTTLIAAGKYKVEANEFGPLSDEARAAMQSIIDDYYNLFVSGVARGRGVPVTEVRGGFGEGRVVTARRAVSLKMADRVATLRETLQRFGASPEQARAAAGGSDIIAEIETEAGPPEMTDAAAMETVRTVAGQLEVRERMLRLAGAARRA